LTLIAVRSHFIRTGIDFNIEEIEQGLVPDRQVAFLIKRLMKLIFIITAQRFSLMKQNAKMA
jgi:hypothetical protein